MIVQLTFYPLDLYVYQKNGAVMRIYVELEILKLKE